jgi:GLPGLI family protein
VFAFYTDEITISGGPVSISGLPGLILGLTIPRLYTSYVATKVGVSVKDTTIMKPITAKKTYDIKGLKALMEEKTKDWFTYGEDKEEDKRQKDMYLWNTLL